MFRLLEFFLLINLIYLFGLGEGKDCKIDQNKDWFDPENVYQCPNDKNCCIEAGKPSCCGDQPVNDQVMDQVKLWGFVVGAAVAIALLICCCRRDNNCCGEDASCKYYLTCGCCGCRKNGHDVSYQKFTPPSPSSESIDSYNKESVLSVNKIDNLKLVSPANIENEAHLQSAKLAKSFA
ncbi:hypothetical protein CHUAL_002436 [Chamberlinius hualienensis]